MKLALSYFYQIRFFKPWMIPISTAKSDPAWFHGYKDNSHWFIDKRGVLNGVRTKAFNTGTIEEEMGLGVACPCDVKEPNECDFTAMYEKGLHLIDVPTVLDEFKRFGDSWCELNNINHEPMIVLIVYEAPWNPCSERRPLLKFFREKGIECNELQYPIKEFYK